MDRDDDVERLFSWIKTPDLHYREFAAEREVADAVATWPALRDAVPEPSPSDERLEPEGSYEGELLPAERARHADRPAAVFGHREPPPSAQPAGTPPPPEDEAAREVPWASEPPQPPPIFTQRESPPSERPQAPPVFVQREPPLPERQQAPPVFVQREPPLPEPPPAPAVQPVPPPPPPVTRHQPVPPPPPPPRQVQGPPGEHEYRGFEEPQPTPQLPAESEEAAKPRSLDAILSRVAHPSSPPRDGRRQPTSAPGLGPVFRRLR